MKSNNYGPFETINPLDKPHPHLNPRQPWDGKKVQTNPPVFVGAYVEGKTSYQLQVSQDKDFKELVIDLEVGRDPIYLPTKAFSNGTYYWKWVYEQDSSAVFSFEVGSEAVVLEIPEVEVWLSKMGKERPRFYFQKKELESLRASRLDSRKNLW